MPRNLTREERNQILILHGQGRNYSQIARELFTTRDTVRLWVQRFEAEGLIEDRPRAHPPRILTADRVQQMVATYEQAPFTPTRQFAEQFDCSLRAVRNALHRAGLHSRRPARKIILTQDLKMARVRFAREYRDADFSHAIFSDEKSFKSSQQGRRHLWRVNNTRYVERNVRPNNESGRIVVNMWGWMSAAGPGELAYIPGRATGQSYLGVLQNIMLPTVRTVYPRDEVPQFHFFQDNCPIHRARIVQDWLRQQDEIMCVPWPSRSPDLNPIENLWALMIQRWDYRNERTPAALIAHCDRIWDTFRGTDLCETLVRSMRSRCDAIIDAGGELTKY